MLGRRDPSAFIQSYGRGQFAVHTQSYVLVLAGVRILACMAGRWTGHALPPTKRQVEVLRAYVLAGSHLDAARRLDVSVRTVQAHLTALRSRLGVHNEAQAVYVLWLGYRDHVGECSQPHHESCMPDMTRMVVRYETGRGVRGQP
jgi:DNA-binding CsgD family transcriptional regulator